MTTLAAVLMMRRKMLRPSRAAVMAVVALLAVACSTAAPTPSPTPAPTSPPTPAPTTPPTPEPTAPPTPAPTEPPTAPPTATPSPAPTAPGEAAFPNEAEALLISYVHPDYQDSCERYDPTYPTELASIECGPEDLPVDYTLFANQADMDAAYSGDLDLGDFPAEPDGKCRDAKYEGVYRDPVQFGDNVAGRVNCRQHTSSSTGSLYHVIEWTSDELLVIGYISNRADLRSWQDLIDFWSEKAGPYKP